jgi:hypothetical protein
LSYISQTTDRSKDVNTQLDEIRQQIANAGANGLSDTGLRLKEKDLSIRAATLAHEISILPDRKASQLLSSGIWSLNSRISFRSAVLSCDDRGG